MSACKEVEGSVEAIGLKGDMFEEVVMIVPGSVINIGGMRRPR